MGLGMLLSMQCCWSLSPPVRKGFLNVIGECGRAKRDLLRGGTATGGRENVQPVIGKGIHNVMCIWTGTSDSRQLKFSSKLRFEQRSLLQLVTHLQSRLPTRQPMHSA